MVTRIKEMLKAIKQEGFHTRSQYHLTLGRLITALEAAPGNLPVQFDDGTPPGDFDSYRGYYEDIAIEDGERPVSVKQFLRAAKTALDTTFIGYKGGDYPATPQKPLWKSNHGEASDIAVIAAAVDGEIFTLWTREVEP